MLVGLGPPINGKTLHAENKSGDEQLSPAVLELALFQSNKSVPNPSPPKLAQLLDVNSKLGFITKFCAKSVGPDNVISKKSNRIFIVVWLGRD